MWLFGPKVCIFLRYFFLQENSPDNCWTIPYLGWAIPPVFPAVCHDFASFSNCCELFVSQMSHVVKQRVWAKSSNGLWDKVHRKLKTFGKRKVIMVVIFLRNKMRKM